MKKTNIRILTFFLIIGFLLITSSYFTNSIKKESIKNPSKNIEITSSTLHKPRSDYEVEVVLHTVDVIVMDGEGRHITNLNKDDFNIYLEGKKQRIASFEKVGNINVLRKREKSLSSRDKDLKTKLKVETKPRNFAFVFANLPLAEARIEKIRNQVTDFITDKVGPKDRIALYRATPSKISEIQPYVGNKALTLKKMEEYFKTGLHKGKFFYDEPFDYGVPEAAMRDSGLVAGMIEPIPGRSLREQALLMKKSEQNLTFVTIMGNIKLLAESMRYIPDRKNIILVTEGFYHWTDLDEQYEATRESEYDPNFASGPKGLQSTIIKFNRSFNQNNVSLYVLDVGRKYMKGVDGFWEEQEAGESGINLDRTSFNIENSRVGSLRSGSETTGGKFFLNAISSIERLKNCLEDINYHTAFYYNISYYPDPKPEKGEYSKIDVEIERDDINVIHRDGISTPALYEDMSKRERDLQRDVVMISSLIYNSITLTSDIRLFPTNTDSFLCLFSLNIPVKEVLYYEENIPQCTLDVAVLAFTEFDKMFNYFHKELNIKLKDIDSENLRYYQYLILPPGDYRVRFFVQNRHNGKMVSNEHRLNIPNISTSVPVVSSILIADDKREKSIGISEYIPLPGQESIIINKDNPIYLEDSMFAHSLKGGVHPPFEPLVLVIVRGISKKEILRTKLRAPVKWTAIMRGNQKSDEIYNIPSKIERIFPHLDGSYGMLYRLDLRGLTPGKYTLKTMYRDVNGGIAASSTDLSLSSYVGKK